MAGKETNGVDHGGELPENPQLMALLKEIRGSRKQHAGDTEAALWARVFAAQAQVLTGTVSTVDGQKKIPELAQFAADGAVRRWRESLARNYELTEAQKAAANKAAAAPENKVQAPAT